MIVSARKIFNNDLSCHVITSEMQYSPLSEAWKSYLHFALANNKLWKRLKIFLITGKLEFWKLVTSIKKTSLPYYIPNHPALTNPPVITAARHHENITSTCLARPESVIRHCLFWRGEENIQSPCLKNYRRFYYRIESDCSMVWPGEF